MVINIFIRKKTTNFHNSIERISKELEKYSKNKSIKVNIIKCPLESSGFLNRLFLVLWAPFFQADINHIFGDINFINLFMNKKKTISTFLDCRLLDNFEGIKKIIYKLFWFQLPINRSDYITFISNFSKKEIQKQLNKKIYRSQVIPVPLISGLSFKINKNKRKKILIVGTMYHKNLNNMLLSLEGLDIDLSIVGDINLLQKKICKEKKIYFKNYVNISDKKIKNLYEKNDILLMASNYEGFGMPIIEAQASGMVVVTSNKEPMRSVAGGSALLVNPKNINDIRNKIKKVCQNKILFKKLIYQGFLNAQKYNSQLIVKKYNDLYIKLLNKNNSQKN